VLFPSIRNYDPQDGTKVAKEFQMLPHAEPTSAVPYPNGMNLGQEGHEAILRKHLEKYGVKVELGTELVSFTQDNDKVDVVLKKVENGNEEKVSVKWLVGADGARSVVRKTLGLSFLGEEQPLEGTVLGDIYMKNGLSRDFWHVWGQPPNR
jgi:2-polyprenyl-6-methoxyphenol hydroxylase-like FAD-dependent oxidoreductase